MSFFLRRADATAGTKRKAFKYLTEARVEVSPITHAHDGVFRFLAVTW